MKRKFRLGILIDENKIPSWSYEMLKIIQNSDTNEIVLIIKTKSETITKNYKFLGIKSNRKNFLFNLYKKFDEKLFSPTPNAFDLKDITTLLQIETIDSEAINIEKIKEYSIDILIRLSFEIPKGNLLKLARYGIWSLHFGDVKTHRGGPSGFWEVMKNQPETGVTLQILNDESAEGNVLMCSYSLTNKLSLIRNKNNYYWKAISFIPLKINELYNIGEENFLKKIHEINKHPNFYSNKILTTPTNYEMLKIGFIFILKKLRNKINNLFYFEQFILLFNLNPFGSISTSFYQYKKMLPPKDRAWADPFILKKENTYYIFFEEYEYTKNKGYISLITMDEKGNYNKPIKVLEKDYHLSYPFLIEENGELYMIPETSDNKTIELYKCIEFPLKWELTKILMSEIYAVDTTIIFKDGKYWLFTNLVTVNGASDLDELFLFYSDSLLSDDWKAHPQNPIISDVKKARGAGKFFTFNGNLYRPSQNCSKGYGYGMKINQVLELTETDYKEIVVDSISPDWDSSLTGTHTINSVDNLTIIDAIMKRKKWF